MLIVHNIDPKLLAELLVTASLARRKAVPGAGKSAPVAYVGGRDAAVRYFHALVESANGRFSHHDGGVEDGAQRLDRVLSQADVCGTPMSFR